MLHYSPYANFYVLNTIFSLNMGSYLWVFLNTLSQATDYLGLMYCPSPYKTPKLRVYCFTVCSRQEQTLASNCHMSTLALGMTEPRDCSWPIRCWGTGITECSEAPEGWNWSIRMTGALFLLYLCLYFETWVQGPSE